MRIEVICTGDEVLTGKIVNSNFSYISQKLEDFGLSLTWETTVGDDRDELLLAFQLGLGWRLEDLPRGPVGFAASFGSLTYSWLPMTGRLGTIAFIQPPA